MAPKHLDPDFFRRLDESDDELFYSSPRFVVHIDQAAVTAIREIYGRLLPKGGAILDLMSSWRSHLPSALAPSKVVGLGLNRAEMEDNPALSEVVIHNLDANPRTPLAEASFDGAIVTVSIQYLIHPVEVFAEVGRLLRRGAPFVVTFSNRMFPTKAVAIWRFLSDAGRMELLRCYFSASGAFENIETIEPALSASAASDSVYAAVGYRGRLA